MADPYHHPGTTRPRQDRRRSPSPGPYDSGWPEHVRNSNDSKYARRRTERDRDSGYASNWTTNDTLYWRDLARENERQLQEKDQEHTKRVLELNQEHQKQIRGSKEKHRGEVQDVTENFQQQNQILRQDLRTERQSADQAVRQLGDERQKVEHLRRSLGEQLVSVGVWHRALEAYHPLLASVRNELRALESQSRPDVTAIRTKRQQLRQDECKYAQVLSNIGRGQEAITILWEILEENRRNDHLILQPATREAHGELCVLLVRSADESLLNETIRLVKQAFVAIDFRALASCDVPWVLSNSIHRARLLYKQKEYAEIPAAINRMWRIKDDASHELAKSVEGCKNELLLKLQQLELHSLAAEIIITTLSDDSRLSDTDLQTFTSLKPTDWTKLSHRCESLQPAERGRAGKRLKPLLSSVRRCPEAERFLTHLSASSDVPTTGSAEKTGPRVSNRAVKSTRQLPKKKQKSGFWL